MTGPGTALVTDADRGSAVTIIRSLGRRGWNVIAADARRGSLGFRSRYATECLVYPRPETAPKRCVEAIESAVRQRGVDLVIPVSDEVILPLARARERFEQLCRLTIPHDEALEQVTDKSRTLELARSLDVPVPESRAVTSVDEAVDAARSMRFPIVVKPAVSRVYRVQVDAAGGDRDIEGGGIDSFSVVYASDVDSLRERVAPLAGRVTLLLQEYCPGVGEGVEMLAHEGHVVAAFQHRRLAEVPLTGGRSAWRESVPLDPQLFDHASRLVRALSWTGLVMVEFRVGEDTRLMEINGRVWGSLPLAVASGMDFPGRLADLYMSGPPADVAPVSDYRVGVRAFDLELTLNWMARVLLVRRRPAGLPIPSRRQVFAAALGLLSPSQKLDLTSRDDWWPSIVEPLKIARKWARKLRCALTGRRRSDG